MEELGTDYVTKEWRLLIDSSKASIRAVLSHNGNEKPSIPLAHAVGIKEAYDSTKLILDIFGYEHYN